MSQSEPISYPERDRDLRQSQMVEGLRILARLIARDWLKKNTSSQNVDKPGKMPDKSVKGENDEDLFGTGRD
jgi:hypothetical protein